MRIGALLERGDGFVKVQRVQNAMSCADKHGPQNAKWDETATLGARNHSTIRLLSLVFRSLMSNLYLEHSES